MPKLGCARTSRREERKQRTRTVPSSFCPTPHTLGSVEHEDRVSKGEGRFVFSVLARQGSRRQQKAASDVGSRCEWLEQYDEWLVSQPDDVRQELDNVPASEIAWQVDGNLHGRQSAAAQYRDRLEEILTFELKEDYEFIRGKLDVGSTAAKRQEQCCCTT